MKCRVDFLGMTNHLASIKSVELQLEGGSTLGHVVEALRSDVPALRGCVIRGDENRLMPQYGFIVNGRFCVDEYDIDLGDVERVLLVTLAMGG